MHYVHNIDPFLLEFGSSGIGIRWYGMAYLTGFVLGYFVIKYMAEKKLIPMKVSQIADFVTYVAIGTMVGGRIGYVLFYKPETLTTFTSSFPFWEVLAVHKGGMASHGGLMGIVVVCIWFGTKYKLPKLLMVDLCTISGTIGITAGRIANFINGELYGRVTAESFKWAVKFPSEIFYWAQYKTQKLASLSPAIEKLGQITIGKNVFQLTSETWQSWVSQYNYNPHARSQVNYTLDKIIEATQSGNLAVTEALQSILSPRYASQLYQAGMEGLIPFFVCLALWLKPRKPGVIAGAFGITYAIMRIVGEQYRMPDAHIGYEMLGLTRGQWLSVGFFIFAVGFLVYAIKQPSEKYGGFLKNND